MNLVCEKGNSELVEVVTACRCWWWETVYSVTFSIQFLEVVSFNQTSVSRLNFNFEILTKPCAQSLNKSLVLSCPFHIQGSYQSILLNGSQSVSEWVRESVSDKNCQWSDSGPIKRNRFLAHQQCQKPTKTYRAPWLAFSRNLGGDLGEGRPRSPQEAFFSS